jgi:hypothetical protein
LTPPMHTNQICLKALAAWRLRASLAFLAFYALLLAMGTANADDNLQSSDLRYLRSLCAGYGTSQDDVKAVNSCKALERAAHDKSSTVAPLMQAKADGKRLTYDDFGKVIAFVSANRLATSVIAAAYHRLGELNYGRQYAVQAIGWSMYDAKDVHALIATFHNQLQGPEYDRQRKALLAQLDADKAMVPDMERLYPGATDETVAKMKMSKTQFLKLMQGL